MGLYKQGEWTIASPAKKSLDVGGIRWHISFNITDERLSRVLYCDRDCLPGGGHLVLISMTAYDKEKKIGSEDQLFQVSSGESYQMDSSWKIDCSLLRIQFHFQMIERDHLDTFNRFIDPSYSTYILNENRFEVNKLLMNCIKNCDHSNHIKRVYGKIEKRDKQNFGAILCYPDIHDELQSLFTYESVVSLIVLDLFSGGLQTFVSAEPKQIGKTADDIMIPLPLKKYHIRDCGKGSDRRSIYLARSFVRRFFNSIFYDVFSSDYSEKKLQKETENKLLNDIQGMEKIENDKAKKNAAINAKKREREKRKKNQKREEEEMKIKKKKEEEEKKKKDQEEEKKKRKDEEEKRRKHQKEQEEKNREERAKVKKEEQIRKKAEKKVEREAKKEKEAIENAEKEVKRKIEELTSMEKHLGEREQKVLAREEELDSNEVRVMKALENAEEEVKRKKEELTSMEKHLGERAQKVLAQEEELVSNKVRVKRDLENAEEQVKRKMEELASIEKHLGDREQKVQSQEEELVFSEIRIMMTLENAVEEVRRKMEELTLMEKHLGMEQNVQARQEELVSRGDNSPLLPDHFPYPYEEEFPGRSLIFGDPEKSIARK